MLNKVDFASLAFEGARFEGAAMPVDVLPELAAYRMVVLAVAKTLFQRNNQDRQRLPKGFEAGFQLVLDRVDEGSAVPVMARIVSPNILPFEDLFDHARDLVEAGILAAAHGDKLPTELSDVLPRFAGFGRTLLPNERIIISRPDRQKYGAHYDRSVRQKLLRLSRTSYEDDVDLLGEVREADKDSEGFALRTIEGRRIEVRPSPAFLNLAVRSLEQSSLVRVRGVGLYDVNGILQRVTTTTDVSQAEEGEDATGPAGCPTPVDEQIKALAALEDGWYDGVASRYDNARLEWLRKLLDAVISAFALPIPYVYPTPEGLARAEWSSASGEVTVNIDLTEQMAEIIAARVGSDAISEMAIKFEEPGSESTFGRFIMDNLAGV